MPSARRLSIAALCAIFLLTCLESEYVPTQRILYVEDNDDVRGAVIELLEKPGRDFIGCASLHTARSALKQQRVHLVITDVNLPDGSGLDLVNDLVDAGEPCEVIVCSGHDMSRMEQHGSPRISFLRKPFELEDLEELVDRLLAAS